jgi:DNA-binding NarL/FixJ family response regulator
MNEPFPRIVIADDHPVFRDGLSGLLDSRGFDVVGEATTGREAVELVRQLQPDMIIMDLHMPDLGGVDATAQITAAVPHTAVLVLTMFDDDTSLAAALRAGARGYLLKGADQDEITRAIDAVMRGGAIFSPSVGDKIRRHYAQASEDIHPFPELTDRERQVLQQLVTGASNADIARALYLSPKTVRNHVSNILTKLQVTDRTQAALVAREAGIR